MLARPSDRVLFRQLGKYVEFFFEQNVIVAQIISKKRIAFGKTAASQDRLCPAIGQGVQRREALKDPNRIVRGQDRDRRAQFDPTCPRGNGRQDHFRCRDCKIGAVVFAKANEVDAKFIGQNRLFDHIADDLIHRFGLTICAKADVAKAIKTKFNLWHVAPLIPA